MRYCFLMLLLSTILGPVVAQQKYYAYFQSDPRTPFYVKIQTQVHSSAQEGYLILPNLSDSTYHLVFGFPENKWPEQEFEYHQGNKDKGFLFRYFKDKNAWGLFDLATAETLMGKPIQNSTEVKQLALNNLTGDRFTVILASVVDDEGLRKLDLLNGNNQPANSVTQAVVRSEAPVQETETKEVAAVAVVGNTPAAKKQETVSLGNGVQSSTAIPVPIPAQPVANEKSDTREDAKQTNMDSVSLNSTETSEKVKVIAYTKIVRAWQIRFKDRVEMAFIDEYPDGWKDTVDVLIQYGNQKNEKESLVSATAANSSSTVKEEDTKPVFLDMTVAPRPMGQNENDDKASKLASGPDSTTVEPGFLEAKEEKPVTAANRKESCKRMATSKDVTNLRSRMVVMTDPEEMVGLAVKNLKQKCFSTENIRSLCYAFLHDEGKFKLIEQAYPLVYDPENYPGLEPVLTQTDYIQRLHDLVKNQ